MNKETKKSIPELRFPEFVNVGEWVEKKLKEVFSIFQGYAFSSEDSVSRGTRWLKIADVGIQQMKDDNPTFLPYNFKEQYQKFLVKKGDYVLALTRPILNMELKIALVDETFHHALLNQRVGKILTSHNSSFVYYLLHTTKMVNNINKKIAGNEPPNLSFQQIENIDIYVPKEIKEQQKIASCLSSLDEVIATHSQKLEALKNHKKGLMQNLFPQVGETVPKYRFPEFVNDGEWVEKSFSELFKIGNGRDYKHLSNGDIPVYGSGGYMLSVNDYLYDGESVCIGRKGTIDKPMFLSGKFWTVDTLFYTHSFNNCKPKFIYYIFQNINWLNHNEAGGVPSLSKTNIYKIETIVPEPNEQQKIVECISSLDTIIMAQAENVEQLKLHKMGLMQGLFPKINE